MTLFASPEKRTAELFAADQVPADWLAFDTLRRPLGGAARLPRRRAGKSVRAWRSRSTPRALPQSRVNRRAIDPDMLLILLAPGSAKPDVLRWRLDNPANIRQVTARLDEVPKVTRASLGMPAMDVLEVQGAVVASVEAGGRPRPAGIQPGDIVTSAGERRRMVRHSCSTIVNAHPGRKAVGARGP